MSYDLVDRVITAVPADLCGGAPAKLVLIALAQHADEAGECYPSVARIAELTGMGRTTVRRALATLEARSLIDVEVRRLDGRQASSRYTLSLPRGPQRTPETPARGPQRTPARGPQRPIQGSAADPESVNESVRRERARAGVRSEPLGTPARLRARLDAAGHPPAVERILRMVCSQWPVLAERHVDVEDGAGAWRRVCGGLSEAEVEAALAWLARRTEPATTPGLVLEGLRARLGPRAAAPAAAPPRHGKLIVACRQRGLWRAGMAPDEMRAALRAAGLPPEALRALEPDAAARGSERGMGEAP